MLILRSLEPADGKTEVSFFVNMEWRLVKSLVFASGLVLVWDIC